MEQTLRKPEWLTIKLIKNDNFSLIHETVKSYGLNTVCEDAHCPNISECWNSGTATFMLMGDTCTRGCRFCAVKTGVPFSLDAQEPKKLAEALGKIKLLEYVVLTSVNRDDLPDGGAAHLASCIGEIKKTYPDIIVEILIPDFKGDTDALKQIILSKPEVIAHNIETVERLQGKVRDRRASYKQSLAVLQTIKELDPTIYTKSSIMLGLGETDEEVLQSMKDLRAVNCDILTIGQYLQPSAKHIKLAEFIRPEKFASFKKQAEELGFLFAAAGPFIRSSYKAGEFFMKNIILKKKENAAHANHKL